MILRYLVMHYIGVLMFHILNEIEVFLGVVTRTLLNSIVLCWFENKLMMGILF